MMLRPEVSLHLPLVPTGEVGPDGYEYPWIEKIVEWLQEHPAASEAFEFDDSETEPTGDDPVGDSWEEVFLLYDVADEAVAVTQELEGASRSKKADHLLSAVRRRGSSRR